jgi:hypothetical protein
MDNVHYHRESKFIVRNISSISIAILIIFS